MKNISRALSLFCSFTTNLKSVLARGTCFLFLLSPAMFFACIAADSERVEQTRTESQKMSIVQVTENEILTLDAFVFNPTGRLDCYQRLTNPDTICEIASGAGDKIVVMIANSDRELYDWTDIRTLSSLHGIYAGLENERRDFPLMTWMQEVRAGQDMHPEMIPIRAEIILRSMSCNFSGLPYASESFHATRAYLTYVNADSSIIPQEGISHPRFVNAGMLNEEDTLPFLERDIIVQDIGETIGHEKVSLNRSFLCYANETHHESIGSPLTRLVIEGRIGLDTYYYPIRLNHENGGIRRGCRYILDITITRAGATDPDGSLESIGLEINMEVEEWKEKEKYTVGY